MPANDSRARRAGRALISVCVAVTALAGCAISSEDVDYTTGYAAALAGAGEHPGSADDVARFQRLMSTLTVDTIDRELDAVYALDAYLNDGLTELRGRDAIKAYLRRSLEQMDELTVRYDDVVRSGNDWYLRWTLGLRFASLRDGALVTTSGMSHLRFDGTGRVVVHRDFWDTASGLYEHIPGIGNAIGDIKERM